MNYLWKDLKKKGTKKKSEQTLVFFNLLKTSVLN